MNNLYEALEICLRDIEQGADIDTVLFRYPDLADELRPILEASINAKSLAVPGPSVEVVRRNRARVLQHAAHRRESGVRQSSRRIWFSSLRRIAVTLMVVAVLFLSGTNLVRAASTTLPGDNLYPVKRTWEDVLLLFTFDMQQRARLALEHENERLHELRELFAEGRSAEVDFAGVVTSQNGNQWVVSGIQITILPQTELRDGPIGVGSAVRVRGETQADGVVLAERVRRLPADATVPDADDDHESDDNGDKGEDEKEDNSGKGSGEEMPEDNNSDNSGSGSEAQDDSVNDSSEEDNSGSGSGDNSGDPDDSNNDARNDNTDDSSSGDNSGSGSGDDSRDDSKDDSGGGDDSSGSGGGGDDD